MVTLLTPSDIWHDITAVRTQSPLVHNITNAVATQLNANVLLASGASPVMAHAHEEVADMVTIAQALVLNIGTLEPYWLQSMQLALRAASDRKIPVVLDPVGVGATRYRQHAIAALMATAPLSIIRGNASEIMSLSDATVHTKGVDSCHGADAAVTAARQLAARQQLVVVVSGAVDYLVDYLIDGAQRWARLSNGHTWMTKITGLGCSVTALIGAFSAVQPDAWRAAVSATAFFGVVGQIAAEQAQAQRLGVGSMVALLLDQLQLLEQATFEDHLRLEVGDGA